MNGPFFAMGITLIAGGFVILAFMLMPRRLLLSPWFWACVPVLAGGALVVISWPAP